MIDLEITTTMFKLAKWKIPFSLFEVWNHTYKMAL